MLGQDIIDKEMPYTDQYEKEKGWRYSIMTPSSGSKDELCELTRMFSKYSTKLSFDTIGIRKIKKWNSAISNKIAKEKCKFKRKLD